MTEKQVFGVIVRGLGVLVVLDGARQAWYLIVRLVLPPIYFRYPFFQDFIYTLLVLALGSIMIRSPELIVSFAWPEESKASN